MTEEDSRKGVIAQTRRRFLQALGGTGAAAGIGSAAAGEVGTSGLDTDAGEIGALSFYSPASQLDANKEPLTDDAVALIRAESEAFNFESTPDGPETVVYPDDVDIPLVSKDTSDPVVGFGSVEFVTDGFGGFRNDNEMFLLNLFDELMGPDSVVAWDESHGQFWTLDEYDSFDAYAANEGYDVQSTDDLLATGSLTFPSTASQIAANGTDPLTDPSKVVVWAEPTAENVDNQGDGAVIYPGDTDIPLVSRDGPVFGVGTPELVNDGDSGTIDENNEQFLLNVLEDTIQGDGIVLWDDAHSTFYDSSRYTALETTLDDAGYEFQSSGSTLSAGLLSADPAIGGETSTHTWRLDGVQFGQSGADGDEVDTITVEYDNASLDGLTDEDITVTMTRTLADGPDTSEINVNSGSYSGSSATFDLSGINQTDVAGPVIVEIDGVTNPSTNGVATITLEDDTGTISVSRQTDLTVAGLSAQNISELEFFSTASILDGSEQPLTDANRIAVWAESTASNENNQGDFVEYPTDTDIPLVGVDGGVVAVGAQLANDASDFGANRSFLVNAWEDRIGEPGTVLYDQTHGQNLTLGDFSQLETLAEDRGFTVDAVVTDFTGTIQGVDPASSAVMIASDNSDLSTFDQSELDALSTFVSNGGTLFLHGTADFEGESSDVLNTILSEVGADLRFNSDQVTDDQNSGFAPYVPRTTNFNEDFEFFGSGSDPATGFVEEARAVVIPSPADAYTQAELDALQNHVDGGGAVLLFDQSEFDGFDETENLNAIADSLGLGFRFNPDQVNDTTNNDGVEFVPTTGNFNEETFDLFGGISAVGLDGSDGVVITTPGDAFTQTELDALNSFVADGGAVFLFDQSDFGAGGGIGFDETENLNEIADSLDLDFRFNSDQVNDEVNNNGPIYDVLTANYDESTGLFTERDTGIGIDFERDKEYYAQVVEIFDGDTFIVEFDEQHSQFNYQETVRHLGMDTAETGGGNDPFEWFGIPDDATPHLDTWGQEAVDFALGLMAPDGAETEEEIEGRSVKIRFDEEEPLRGGFGRLLTYMDYDPDSFAADPDTGNFDTEYNLKATEEGYSRVYASGFGRYDEYAAVEESALDSGTGLWSAADFDALSEYRTGFVDGVFVPRASSVTTASGPLSDRDILQAPETATQESLGDGYDEYEDAPPLAAVDPDNRVAVFGGIPFDEAYEAGEDDDISDSINLDETGNFQLFTNTVELLSENDGPFLVEAGHGQFGASGSVSREDLKFYLRHVEGLSGQVEDDVRLRQITDIAATLPDEPEPPRAVFLTAPASAYTQAELDALETFRDDGGAVVLVGSAAADPGARARLDNLAGTLGSDLRLNGDAVVDDSGPVDGRPDLLLTHNLDGAGGLRVRTDLNRDLTERGRMAVLNNIETVAWRLEEATAGVGPTGEENPTLNLSVGDRHYVQNRGYGTHPLELRDADGNALLSQEAGGSFEGDPAVNWVDTGDVVEFTVTEDLAEALDTYICTNHSSMAGSIEIGEGLGPPQLSPVFDGAPNDPDGDGVYEDINGDGNFDIFDVQALFELYNTEIAQENTEYLDFNGDTELDIFDVQALFEKL